MHMVKMHFRRFHNKLMKRTDELAEFLREVRQLNCRDSTIRRAIQSYPNEVASEILRVFLGEQHGVGHFRILEIISRK